MRSGRVLSLPSAEKGRGKKRRGPGGADPAGMRDGHPAPGGFAVDSKKGEMRLDCTTDQEKKKKRRRTVREGEAQEKSCQLRQRMQLLLEMPLTDPQQKEVLKNAGLPVRYRDRLQLIAWNLYQKALEGDMGAIRELRSIMAEPRPGREKGRIHGPGQEGKLPVVIVDDVR